jgi:hypothetical protein
MNALNSELEELMHFNTAVQFHQLAYSDNSTANFLVAVLQYILPLLGWSHGFSE